MNTPPRFLLRIPLDLYEEMLEQAVAEMPNECCGLLAGRLSEDRTIGAVLRRYPLVNELASPREFLSEPRSMFVAIKAMRAEGLEVLAVYHSHPASAPIPSQADLERNYSSSVMNFIIGFKKDRQDVRAWWLSETNYEAGQFETFLPETPVGVEPT